MREFVITEWVVCDTNVRGERAVLCGRIWPYGEIFLCVRNYPGRVREIQWSEIQMSNPARPGEFISTEGEEWEALAIGRVLPFHKWPDSIPRPEGKWDPDTVDDAFFERALRNLARGSEIADSWVPGTVYSNNFSEGGAHPLMSPLTEDEANVLEAYTAARTQAETDYLTGADLDGESDELMSRLDRLEEVLWAENVPMSNPYHRCKNCGKDAW